MFARLGQRFLSIILLLLFGIAIGSLYDQVGNFMRARVNEITRFAAGHPLESETTVWQKVQNDLGIAPWRTAREAEIPAHYPYQTMQATEDIADLLEESELQLYVDPESALARQHAGLLVKTQVSTERGYAYRLLVLGFDGIVYRALNLGDAPDCNCDASEPLNYFHIAGDPASIEQSGNQLIRVNSCGATDWSIDSRYSFHHYLNNDGDHQRARFWILDASDLVQVNAVDGRVSQRISLSEIINANPELHIFESRLLGNREGRWQYGDAEFVPLGRTHTDITNADPEPFHSNDIDEYLGEDTGLFQRGDLVLSLRSQNLIVVVRPESRKIVWYAYGLTSRQHDPDFLSADSVMVYDNNFHNPTSRIVELTASAETAQNNEFNVLRETRIDSFDGNAFHQLTEGYQFLTEDEKTLVFSAGYYDVGVDLDTQKAVLAVRHRWQDQAYLKLEIERLLSRTEIDSIREARCQ